MRANYQTIIITTLAFDLVETRTTFQDEVRRPSPPFVVEGLSLRWLLCQKAYDYAEHSRVVSSCPNQQSSSVNLLYVVIRHDVDTTLIMS